MPRLRLRSGLQCLLAVLAAGCQAIGRTPETRAPALDARPGKELVENGSFEEWNEEGPVGWATGPSPEGAIQSAEAPYGFLAADLLSGGDQYTVLWQDLRTEEVLPEARLHVSCVAKAPEPNQLALSLSFLVDGERTKETRIYDGHGEWRTIRFVVNVPAGADTGSFSIRLLRRPGYDGQVLADDVSVRLE